MNTARAARDARRLPAPPFRRRARTVRTGLRGPLSLPFSESFDCVNAERAERRRRNTVGPRAHRPPVFFAHVVVAIQRGLLALVRRRRRRGGFACCPGILLRRRFL